MGSPPGDVVGVMLPAGNYDSAIAKFLLRCLTVGCLKGSENLIHEIAVAGIVVGVGIVPAEAQAAIDMPIPKPTNGF